MPHICDFLIFGGGIAGASIGYRLAPHGKVIICEMESQPGYHTTGRSAAFYAETYGGSDIRPLTMGSKDFLKNPPEGFCDVPLITKRGALHIFDENRRVPAEEICSDMQRLIEGVHMISRHEVLEVAPILSSSDVAGAICDQDCGDLDVFALHQGFLQGFQKRGGEILNDAEMIEAKQEGGSWLVRTRKGEVRAKVIVNCAGAWGDVVAERAGIKPIGLTPLRRTIVMVPAEGIDPDGPIVIDVDEDYYFKPENGQYMVSPGDETLSPACDAQPEVEDVAVAVDKFERATNSKVKKIENSWAGLRTFAPDRAPVIGFDDACDSFFWSVGQGGYGIQTAPAWSSAAASLIVTGDIPGDLKVLGGDKEKYSPSRLRN